MTDEARAEINRILKIVDGLERTHCRVTERDTIEIWKEEPKEDQADYWKSA